MSLGNLPLDSSSAVLVRRPIPVSAPELANSLTHGLGWLLALWGLASLMPRAASEATGAHQLGCAAFGLTLVGMYAASTLSHVFADTRWRTLFRSLDQALIYLLIAGTYTPWATSYLKGGWWWLLSALMWTGAILGFLSKILLAHRVDRVSIRIYVFLCAFPLVTLPGIVQVMPLAAVFWMLLGGACYAFGVLFLMRDQQVPYFHAVWHLCVLIGSGLHFYAVYQYTLA